MKKKEFQNKLEERLGVVIIIRISIDETTFAAIPGPEIES